MSGSHDPKVEVDYNLVLADMKARHAALGRSIAAMEAWLKGGGAPLTVSGGMNGDSSSRIDVDTFAGLNIPGAGAKYLRMMGKPARTTDAITKALNEGGLKCTQASVATVLGREGVATGDIYKVARGLWGLKEWYSNSNNGNSNT
jgi:hypothetical protein